MKRLLIYGALFICSAIGLFAETNTLVGKIENGLYYSPSNLFVCRAEDFGEGDCSIEDHAEKGFQLVQFTNSDESFSFVTGVMPISTKSRIPSFILKELVNRQVKTVKKRAAKDEKVSVLEKGVIEKNTHFAVTLVEKKSNSKSKEPTSPQTFKGVLVFQHEDKIALMYIDMNFPTGKACTPQECVEGLRVKLLKHQEQMQFPVSSES